MVGKGTEFTWAQSTWGEEFAVPVYYSSIPLVLPVGARLEIKRRTNKRTHTTTETIIVRMPKKA